MTDTRPGSTGPPRPVPPTDPSPARLMRWTVDVINSHDAEALRAVWGPETLERFPTATYRGPDALAAYFQRLFAALPDMTLTILGLVEQGEQVFMRWRLRGTHTGAELEGIAPTGARLDIDGVDHVTVRDGMVVSNVVVYDQMQLARQLGLLPDDGSRADAALKWAFNALARRRARR